MRAPWVGWLAGGRGLRLGWVLLCLLAAAGAGWTVVTFFGGPFVGLINSDAAVPPLLAQEMLRTRAWVPTSWYYVNDDIWVLGPQLYALPFVSAWGASSRALAAGNILGLAATGAFVFLLARRMTGSKAAALLVTLGVLAPFSQIQRDVVYVQLAYGFIFGYLCLLLYLALRSTEEPASRVGEVLTRKPLWLYALLVALLFAGSTARGLVYWLVPVLGVSLLETRSARVRAQFIGLAVASAVASAIGTAVHFALRSGLRTKAWDVPFRTTGGWGRKLEAAWQGLPLLIGTPPDAGSGWLSQEGSLSALRAAFLGCAVAALVVVWRGVKEAPPQIRVGARVTSLMVLSVGVAFVASRMVNSPWAVRYLLPPALLGLLTLLGLSGRWLGPRSAPFLTVLIVFVAAFVGGGVLRTAREASLGAPGCAGEARLCAPLALADTNGVHTGFATYWNANAATLASGGAVRACAIRLDPPLQPQRWLNARDCFVEDAYRAGFFVLLEATERDLPATAVLLATLGPPSRRVSAGEFELWVYEPSAARDWAWLSR
jgi:hypothetical protein